MPLKAARAFRVLNECYAVTHQAADLLSELAEKTAAIDHRRAVELLKLLREANSRAQQLEVILRLAK